jgi:peptidoglycan lytic transglycosylase
MLGRQGVVAAFASAALLAACQNLSTPPATGNYPTGFTQVGLASWYGPHFHGRHTANGERFDMNGLTAAHRTLPLNSYVRVIDLATGRSVVVRINDRGPYLADRIIDLSAEAARELGLKERGIARVRIDIVGASEARLQGRHSFDEARRSSPPRSALPPPPITRVETRSATVD